MAFYKYSAYLSQNNLGAFDEIHEPGALTPHSGIYRCEGCGHEITSIQNNPLPPQNHHQHTMSQGRIRWRLIVRTTHTR
jgi:hypothetical protein